MCGISGILSPNRTIDPSRMQAMVDMLEHRGPDGKDVWFNQERTVAFGHNRLAIIDLSDSANQPMATPDGRFVITFNGEIYNYVELAEDLQAAGVQLSTTSDTEVLLMLFARDGKSMLAKLDGMFAFAIWDNSTGTLFCARDRFGEKPFYYSTNGVFSFASEMKALFASGVTKRVNEKKVFDFILYSTLEDPYNLQATFYDGVSQLPGGHWMEVDAKLRIQIGKYWDIDWQQEIAISEQDAIEEFRRLFQMSVARRLRSDVPVGSSLSGGLDSSSIVMEIHDQLSEGAIQKTFSARFPGYHKDESPYIDMVLDKINVEAHAVTPSEESAIQYFKDVCYYQEEPFGSMSILAQYEVMKLAKSNGIKVMLDGQGADETLAGYVRYLEIYLASIKDNEVRKRIHAEMKKVQPIDVLPDLDVKLPMQTENGIARSTLNKIRRSVKRTDSPYFVGIHPDVVSKFKADPNPLLKPQSLKEALYQSTLKRGLNELLRYADRNAMAHSVEVRLPFLNHELVEFIFSLPEELLIGKGWTKYILRRSMEHLLPGEIAWRKDKVGYEPPQQKWMQQEDFVKEMANAVDCLKDHKMIQDPLDRMGWKYLMVARLFD